MLGTLLASLAAGLGGLVGSLALSASLAWYFSRRVSEPIAELKRAYRMCQYAPEPTAPEPEDETSSNLIIKVTQTPQAWLPDTKILREWHRELTQLIDGFRNEMVEF